MPVFGCAHAAALNPGRRYDLGAVIAAQPWLYCLGFGPLLGVDKWGGWLADSFSRAGILVAKNEARAHRSVSSLGRIVDRGQLCLGLRDLGMPSPRPQLRHNGFRIFDNNRAAVSDGQLHFICRFLGCRR